MLKLERIILFVLIVGAAAFAVVNWRRATLFQADNEELRAKVTAIEAEIADDARAQSAASQELETLKQRSAELMKLRNEVTQLRTASNEVQKLAAENQRLKAQIQQLRGGAGRAAQATGGQPPSDEQFPRESWRFAGYASPESALVSAIWAMKEGNPQSYMESLSPNEQQRAAQTWQNMTPEQIAAKHKNDVANITGMRVLEKQNLAPDEILMNVYLEGPGRVEKVRLNQVGQEWKFSGFVRPPQAAAPAPQPQ